MLIGFGSFGIIFLQAFAALAILVYLRRHGGEPAWVMAATWLGVIGLCGATIFVALYFKLLATSEATSVGLLPFVFPIIVLSCLGLGAWTQTIRPRRMDARGAVRPLANGPSLPASGGDEFLIRGGAGAEIGAWRIRYENAAGRELTSEAKPTLDAAISAARQLRDQRGAIVLEIMPDP